MEEFNEAKKYFEINCDIHESMTNPGSKLFNKRCNKIIMTKVISIINQKGGVENYINN